MPRQHTPRSACINNNTRLGLAVDAEERLCDHANRREHVQRVCAHRHSQRACPAPCAVVLHAPLNALSATGASASSSVACSRCSATALRNLSGPTVLIRSCGGAALALRNPGTLAHAGVRASAPRSKAQAAHAARVSVVRGAAHLASAPISRRTASRDSFRIATGISHCGAGRGESARREGVWQWRQIGLCLSDGWSRRAAASEAKQQSAHGGPLRRHGVTLPARTRGSCAGATQRRKQLAVTRVAKARAALGTRLNLAAALRQLGDGDLDAHDGRGDHHGRLRRGRGL